MHHARSLLQDIWHILQDAKTNFQQGEPIVYSAAIAFFTIFSLPALLLIIMLLGSTFFSEEKVREKIVTQVAGLISRNAATQVDAVLGNVVNIPAGFWGILIGVAVVIKSATIMFFIMQKALNAVWQVRVKPKVNYLQFLKYRLATLFIVAFLGLLFMLSLLLDTVISMYREELSNLFQDYFTPTLQAINTTFYVSVVFVFLQPFIKCYPMQKLPGRMPWQVA